MRLLQTINKTDGTHLSDDIGERVALLSALHHLLCVNGALLESLVVLRVEVQVLEALGGVGLVVPCHLSKEWCRTERGGEGGGVEIAEAID